jgi:hypothetical protein
MMSPEEIARHYRERGEEVTPDEVRTTLASIAAKFRKVDPTLPDDDDELMRIVLTRAKVIDGSES